MALPSYKDKGTFTSGTASLSVPPPATIASGDFCLLVVESANQAVSTPTDWTQAPSSPQGQGTGALANAVRVTVFYKTAGASEGNVTVADSGDHTTAIWLTFSNVDTSDPFDASSGGTIVAGTSWSLVGLTTTVANCLIVHCVATDRDLTSTTNLDSYSNADLANITEIHDQSHALSTGGGIIVVTGEKASAGTVGNTSATSAASEEGACVTLALQGVSGGGGFQVSWARNCNQVLK